MSYLKFMTIVGCIFGCTSLAFADEGDATKQRAMIDAFARADFSLLTDGTSENAMLMVMHKPDNKVTEHFGRQKVLLEMEEIRKNLSATSIKKCDFTPEKRATFCEFDNSGSKPTIKMMTVGYSAKIDMTAFAIGLED